MQTVVGVKFENNGKIYYFDPKKFDLKLKDKVIVDTASGLEMGEVALNITQVEDSELSEPLKKVVRKANEKDFQTIKNNKEKAKKVLVDAKKIIEKSNLDMDLVDVEYSFDGTRIIFTYTAEGRVDFRDLLKDFASAFKARIELKQIGIRDETKMLGGLGPCGRECCCKLHLKDFEKVSIKMAKNQGLSLNPTSISGLCGRLMCCLAYENDYYAEIIKDMPKLNSVVKTPDGEGTVMYNNILKKTVTVKIKQDDESLKIQEYGLDEIQFNKVKPVNE